jgi:hypothetical protein
LVTCFDVEKNENKVAMTCKGSLEFRSPVKKKVASEGPSALGGWFWMMPMAFMT